MHATLLPDWLRAVWIIASCAVAVLHLCHVWAMSGQRRYWHVGHVMMALGMAYMYLPPPGQVIPNVFGLALFVTAAGVSVSVFLLVRIGDGAASLLWLMSAAEMAVMAYMFMPMNAHFALLSYGLAAYLVVIGLSWVLGTWDPHYLRQRNDTVVHTMSGSIRPTAVALRLSLATMAVSMAFMLVAM